MKIKLVISDDHKLFAQGLKELITQSLPVEVVAVVFNGKEAIEACIKHKADWVIMDINMPLMDGIYACKEIKSISPQTKVCILTMFNDIASLSNAWSAGADAYLLKGNNIDEVLKAYDVVKIGKRYVCEELSHLVNNNINRQQKIEAPVSVRESAILKLICQGLTNDEIGRVFSISTRTVDTHRNNMLTKLKLPNTAALVRFAVESKLV